MLASCFVLFVKLGLLLPRIVSERRPGSNLSGKTSKTLDKMFDIFSLSLAYIVVLNLLSLLT